jgi:hypothetical protein
MGSYCSTSVCCANEVNEENSMIQSSYNNSSLKSRVRQYSTAAMLTTQVEDEQEVRKLEQMVTAKV